MSLRIVTSRYKESVDWAESLPVCTVYNKGANDCVTRHPIVVLPNVGREGHTYLHHIIENYDALDDYTIFLQGYPFDHTPYLESFIKNNEWKKPFCNISRRILKASIQHDPHVMNPDVEKLLVPCFNRIFNRNKTEHSYYFGAGAQFSVSRETIRTRPKEFYERIRDMLSYSANPLEGFVLERFWSMIFLGENLEERGV